MTNQMNPQTQGAGSQQPQHNIHDFCRNHLYQMVLVQIEDGKVHAGILHSFDDEQMYMIMPVNQQDQSQSDNQRNDSRLFFPFFGPFGLFGFPFWGIRRWGPYYPYWW